MIFNAKSLMESIVAINFLLSTDGFISFNSLIEHVRNGFLEITFSISNLFFPCIIIVRFPSGICKTLRIFATVPILLISPMDGSETFESF